MRRAILALHALLLRVLLPAAFRSEYGEELQVAVEARLGSRRGIVGVLSVGALECLDLLRTAARERWTAVSAGGERVVIGSSIDIRGAIRGLARTPAISVIAVVTLSLAIGANTAVFSVVDTVLLDPLAFPEPERLVSIRGTAPGSDLSGEFGVAPEFYVQYRENATALADLGMYQTGDMTVRTDERVERLPISVASPSLFSTLGVECSGGCRRRETKTHRLSC